MRQIDATDGRTRDHSPSAPGRQLVANVRSGSPCEVRQSTFEPVRAIREAALEVLASVGVVLPALPNLKLRDVLPPLSHIERSGKWIGAVAVALVVFTALLGAGVR